MNKHAKPVDLLSGVTQESAKPTKAARNQTPLADAIDVMSEHGKPAAEIVGVIKAADFARAETEPDNYPHDWPHSRDIQGQHETRILGLQCGGVELRQAGQLCGPDDDEAAAIEITAGNVVKLALGLLDAAGFKNITITTRCDDGEQDLKPGSLASDFTWSPPRPVAAPTVPLPVKPRPEPEAKPYNPWDDESALVLDEQRAVAVYLNPLSGLVIRQMDDADSTIIILADNIPKFVARVAEVTKGD